MKEYTRNPLWTIAIFIGGGLYIILLVYIASTSSIPLAISVLAVSVAAVATIANLRSLQWTRATIRPFLSLSLAALLTYSIEGNIVKIDFKIQNSGSLPATDVHPEITFFNIAENVTEENLSCKYPQVKQSKGSVLLFPNNHICEELSLDLGVDDEKEIWDNIQRGQVKFRIRIKYRNRSREYVTIQTEQIVKVAGLRGLETIPIHPQKAE